MSTSIPKSDGDIYDYQNVEARSTKYWQSGRRVFFINGMCNSGANHAESALGLSKLQMCTVTGVYNKTDGTGIDFLQCIADKLQFSIQQSTGKYERLRKDLFKKAGGNAAKAEQIIIGSMAKLNAAVPALFKLLKHRPGNLNVFAHSQGNLILSNVLTAILVLYGEGSLSRFTVNSFGSPAMTWPPGFTHNEYAFTFDPVSWLGGINVKLNISKVGCPQIPEGLGVAAHGFKSYMADDAKFIINQFRWGAARVTANMDEEGLANTLVSMQMNTPRIRAIFQLLYSDHNNDVDDVAVLYVTKISNLTKIINAVKADNQLRALLIKSMEEGPTLPDEDAAIAVLKN